MTLKEILANDKLVLIDFFSADCPPCLLLKEILEKVKNAMGDQCGIYTIDQVNHSDVFKAFNVKTVPHLKLFKKGKPVWNGSGLLSEDELVLIIQKHL